jgi:hypothetical protein
LEKLIRLLRKLERLGNKTNMNKLKWFCKHCQVEGEVSFEGMIDAGGLIRLVRESHKKVDGTDIWVLVNLPEQGTIECVGTVVIWDLARRKETDRMAELILLHVQ